VLGFIIGFIILVHIALLHTVGSSNPLLNSGSLLIPFYAIFFKDCFFTFSLSIFFCSMLYLDIDIFGNCDNLIIANPSSTPNHIVPE
jgi:ubiquinol-cytochrome c reductase cytochrome b subunit